MHPCMCVFCRLGIRWSYLLVRFYWRQRDPLSIDDRQDLIADDGGDDLSFGVGEQLGHDWLDRKAHAPIGWLAAGSGWIWQQGDSPDDLAGVQRGVSDRGNVSAIAPTVTVTRSRFDALSHSFPSDPRSQWGCSPQLPVPVCVLVQTSAPVIH